MFCRQFSIARRPAIPAWLAAGCLSSLVLCSISMNAVAESGSISKEEIAETVKHLGTKQLGANDRYLDVLCADFEKLALDPGESVRTLIPELHSIQRKAYYPGKKPADELHVVSVLRALHYLTGTTFSAKTKAKLSDLETNFLDFNKQPYDKNPSHEVHFFGNWMSRDADVVAPEDAQRQIIEKWHRWLETDGKNFNTKPAKSPAASSDDWVWYG